jgi:hypothetical protein
MTNAEDFESGPVSEKHLSLKPLVQAIAGIPPDRVEEIFDALAERLIASQARAKQIQRALADGWAPEDVMRGLCARVDWRKAPPKPPGHPKGSAVDGPKLKALRGDLTQEDLAAECNLDVTTIQRGEVGGPWSPATFETVAATLTRFGKPVSAEDLQTR